MRLITITLVELCQEERAFMRHWRGRRLRKTVAHEIGISVVTLDSWEGGARNPPVEKHARWIEVLRLLDQEAAAA